MLLANISGSKIIDDRWMGRHFFVSLCNRQNAGARWICRFSYHFSSVITKIICACPMYMIQITMIKTCVECKHCRDVIFETLRHRCRIAKFVAVCARFVQWTNNIDVFTYMKNIKWRSKPPQSVIDTSNSSEMPGIHTIHSLPVHVRVRSSLIW